MPDTVEQERCHQLREHVSRLPRFALGHFPTPLEHLPRFSKALGGPEIYIKRDDCTGLAFGGNKTRHNEFLMGAALQQGADLFVWGAGVQSNNCRQTAAACAKAGLDCHLVLGRGGPADGPDEVQGNLLLDHLVGASFEIVEESVGPELDDRIAEVAEQQRQQGRNVYLWDRHTVKPLAAVSYMLCMAEFVEQSTASGTEFDEMYVCSAGSTGSGLALAAKYLNCPFPVRNISPIVWPWETKEDMAQIANEAAELTEMETRLDRDEIDYTTDYVGPEYGKPTPACLEAIALLARTEGILLDPVYSGKAMAGLIDHIRQGRIAAGQTVVFVHTGGTPALFAFHKELATQIAARSL